jgi:HEAT repeat protein
VVIALGGTGGRADEDAPPAGAIPELDILKHLAGLKADNPDVRKKAARDLGEFGLAAKAAVPRLIATLRDTVPEVRQAAAAALGNIGPEAREAARPLSQAVKDADPQVREAAAKALGQIRPADREAVQALIDTLHDPSDRVRSAAVVALGKIGPAAKGAVPELVRVLRDRQAKPDLRRAAAEALGRAEADAAAVAGALTEALRDPDAGVRSAAALTLGRIGADAKQPVSALAGIGPALSQLLQAPEADVRQAAAVALGMLGPEARGAVPALAGALGDKATEVRWVAAEALGNLGREAREAVPALRGALADPFLEVRRAAAFALGQIGPEAVDAVPDLMRALNVTDWGLRQSALVALGRIGPRARAAVPAIAAALQDPEPDVKRSAAEALGRIGPAAKGAVPALLAVPPEAPFSLREAVVGALGKIGSEDQAVIQALQRALQDEDASVRQAAAEALGRVGLEIRTAVPALIRALKDKNANVRKAVALALGKIAPAAAEARPALEEALKDPDVDVRRAAQEALDNLARPPAAPPSGDGAVLLWVALGFGILVLAVTLPWALVYWLQPLLLLRFDANLRRHLTATLATVKVQFHYPPLARLLIFRPRVLEAWVASQAERARTQFLEKPLVQERRLHVPVPVHGVEEGHAVSSLGQLRPLFAGKRALVLICGEAGSGKTSLACQLGLAALDPDPGVRLGARRMLPVLIEAAGLRPSPEDPSPLLTAVHAELKELLGPVPSLSRELVAELLRQQRLLVILDGLSALDPEAQRALRFTDPEFPVTALVITSRLPDTLGGAPRSLLTVGPLAGNELVNFVEKYLEESGERHRFRDQELFDACSRLARMAEGRAITALLAKLYTERMIAVKAGPDEGGLPNSLLDLIVHHLNRLQDRASAAGAAPDWRAVQRDAEAVAWECLRHQYRPAPAARDAVLGRLREAEPGDAAGRLAYLEDRLGILRSPDPERRTVRFTLGLLAEYLAGLYLVKSLAEDESAWEQFLAGARAQPGAPESVRSFLLAVRDCCLASPAGIWVPETVLEQQLAELTGVVSEEAQAELLTAGKQMAALFPQENPVRSPGVSVGHRRRQASTVSGDFYGIIPRPDGSLGVYAVDVEGHGVPAANQARSLYQTLTDVDWGGGDAHGELCKADELVRQGPIFRQEDAAFTMNFTEVDPVRHTVRHANAGMPFPLLFRRGEARPRVLRAAGVYVGAGYGSYPVSPPSVEEPFEPGDLLVLFSDGVLEARDEKGHLFSEEGITVAVLAHRDRPPEEIAERVLQAAARHAGKPTPEDDQIVLIVQTEAVPLREQGGEFHLVNAADLDVARAMLEARFRREAEGHGFRDPEQVGRMWDALQEALHHGITFGTGPGEAVRVCPCLPDGDGRLRVALQQPRPWGGWEEHLGPARRRDGRLVALAEEVQVSDGGRRLTLWFSPFEVGLVNDDDVGQASARLEARFRAHAEGHGFVNAEQVRRMWAAVAEALQNGIKFGTGPGEEVLVRSFPPDAHGRLRVALQQPRPWEGWEEHLGPARQQEVKAGPLQPGGTFALLALAEKVEVTDGGRRLTLWFPPFAFALVKNNTTGQAFEGLEKGFKGHLERRDFAARDRVNQMWSAVDEALQNAVKYGSEEGEQISLRWALPNGAGLLEVIVLQPRVWADWEDYFGPARQAKVAAGVEVEGGTVIILKAIDAIHVTDEGRRLGMKFGPVYKDLRPVQFVVPGP